MKIALVTTPASVPSGIGDYARALLPHLRRLATVDVYVEDRHAGSDGDRSIADLKPRAYEHVLYQLGNERAHAFMAPLVRAVGGTVVLHDWVLFDLTMARFPALVRGGLFGRGLALREGGWHELGVYARRFRARRRARKRGSADRGPLAAGWHAPEPDGRWTTDEALIVPPPSVRRVVCELSGEPGRRTRLSARAGGVDEVAWTDERRAATLALELDGATGPIALRTNGRRPAVASDDARELGVFVRAMRFEGGPGQGAVDLSAPRASAGGDLSDDRFELALNRSIVRFADGFLVHSQTLRERILASRNAPTPIGVVPHGAEPTWRPDDREAARARLGLPAEAFVVASFGRIQAHKRPHVLLAAIARARRVLPAVELALVGGCEPGVFDLDAALRDAALSSGVHRPGHVPEEDIATWLAAADVVVQLRGPSTGGTSGGAFRAYAAGRGVVASALDEQEELPDACTAFVQPGDGEEERLSALLVALARDPDRRAAMELEARRFVEERAHWRLVAQRYVEHLERFPRARASRRALFVLALQRSRAESTGSGPS